MVYCNLNYGILNWAAASRSSIADLVKLNNRAVFNSETFFIQHGYYRSRIFTIMN